MNRLSSNNPLIGELFIDAICDIGFKKILSNEEILVDFLNTFLPDGTPKIVSANLLPEEKTGDNIHSKVIYFDVHAKDNNGKNYIIEVQRRAQDFFINRSLYYSSREISSQGESGELKDYDFSPVYNISILNFVPKADWAYDFYNVFSYRKDKSFEKLTDKTAQILILLPLMNLTSDELKDRRTKWCYLLRNAVKLNKEKLSKLKWTDETIFEKIKKVLYVAGLTEEERRMFDEATKNRMDMQAWEHQFFIEGEQKGFLAGEEKGRTEGKIEGHLEGLREGEERGRTEGKLEGLIATALNMLKNGFDIKTITKCVDLPEEKIQEIKDSLGKE